MNPPAIDHMERQLRFLKSWCVALTCALGVLVLSAATRPDPREISVERINIVDAAGKTRLVIANSERMPPPIVNGKPLPRAVQPAGILFYNAEGTEVGGLALSGHDGGRLSALVFDYGYTDAVGMLTRIDPAAHEAVAGLIINSHPDESLSASQAIRSGSRRVALQNHNETAELVLSDSEGRPRLRLSVSPEGKPGIEMLDEHGANVYSVVR
jgi:hypothetical protein